MMKLVSLCSFSATIGVVMESNEDEVRGRTILQLAAESNGTYADDYYGHTISKLSSSVGSVSDDNDAKSSAGTVEELTEDSEAKSKWFFSGPRPRPRSAGASCKHDEGATCKIWPCAKSRNAHCTGGFLNQKCTCAKGQCSVNGVCKAAPTTAAATTPAPSTAPTPEPTDTPTGEPTEAPTPEPTDTPTGEPTEGPTPEPTDTPTGEPTGEPTEAPTQTKNKTKEQTPTEACLKKSKCQKGGVTCKIQRRNKGAITCWIRDKSAAAKKDKDKGKDKDKKKDKKDKKKACSLAAKYKEKGTGNTVQVTQSGSSIKVKLGSSKHGAQLSGCTLTIEGFGAKGKIEDNGDVTFADGGKWVK